MIQMANSIIETISGRLIDILNPKPSDIHLEDIIIPLSRTCRFGGHTRDFYTVLMHSYLCAIEAEARGYSFEVQKALLVHDFSEAYCSDVITPLKLQMPKYYEIENEVLRQVEIVFEVDLSNPLIKEVDYDMAVGEALWQMRSRGSDERWTPPTKTIQSDYVIDRIVNPPSINESILEFHICRTRYGVGDKK